ncbi:hypothetical protein LINGRAHAP2_LOCUS21058 [Linum grandiflorum]
MSLDASDDEGVSLMDVVLAPQLYAYRMCVEGTFIGDQAINFTAMKRTMTLI